MWIMQTQLRIPTLQHQRCCGLHINRLTKLLLKIPTKTNYLQKAGQIEQFLDLTAF